MFKLLLRRLSLALVLLSVLSGCLSQPLKVVTVSDYSALKAAPNMPSTPSPLLAQQIIEWAHHMNCLKLKLTQSGGIPTYCSE